MLFFYQILHLILDIKSLTIFKQLNMMKSYLCNKAKLLNEIKKKQIVTSYLNKLYT